MTFIISRTKRTHILKNKVCLINFQLGRRLLPWQPSFSKFSALMYVGSLVYTYLYYLVLGPLKILFLCQYLRAIFFIFAGCMTTLASEFQLKPFPIYGINALIMWFHRMDKNTS